MSIYIALEKLEKELLATLRLVSTMDNKKNPIVSQTIEIYKKIRLARLLGSKSMIAIGGMQGAGKTTLISQIYGLSDWLSGNMGRGEKIPVLIREDRELTNIIAYKTAVDDQGEVVTQSCDNEEFKSLVQGLDSKLLLLELAVPPKFNLKESTVWVLLPGYEQETYENAGWQRLMRYVVQYASAKIIVTDAQRMAKGNQVIIDDLNKNLIQDDKPLIVISRTEDQRNNPEALQELIERAKEVFNVDQQNIMCSGNDVENWWEEFDQKAGAVLSAHAKTEQAYIKDLLTLVEDDISSIIGQIEDVVDREQNESIAQERQINKIISTFELQCSKYRKDYDLELKSSLNTLKDSAIKRAKEQYKEEEEGIANTLSNLGKRLILRGSDIDEKRQDRIDNAWKMENVIAVDIDVVSKINNQKLSLPKVDKSCQQYLGYQMDLDEEKAQSIQVKDEHVNGLNILLRAKDTDVKERIEITSQSHIERDIEKGVKILPMLVMEHYRYYRTNVAQTDRKADSSAFKEEYMDAFKNSFRHFENLPKNTNNVYGYVMPLVKAMGLVAGADVMAHGKLDGKISINQTETSDAGNNSTGASAGVALTMARLQASMVGAMLAAAVIYSAYEISKHIYHIDQGNKRVIDYTINEYATNTRLMLLANFDESMEKIADLIRENLETLYGVGGQITKDHYALVVLKHLKKAQKNATLYLTNDVALRG